MALEITERRQDPNDIILYCYECKRSTVHTTITKDKFTRKWRKRRQSRINPPPFKAHRQCKECGNIVRF